MLPGTMTAIPNQWFQPAARVWSYLLTCDTTTTFRVAGETLKDCWPGCQELLNSQMPSGLGLNVSGNLYQGGSSGFILLYLFPLINRYHYCFSWPNCQRWCSLENVAPCHPGDCFRSMVINSPCWHQPRGSRYPQFRPTSKVVSGTATPLIIRTVASLWSPSFEDSLQREVRNRFLTSVPTSPRTVLVSITGAVGTYWDYQLSVRVMEG